MADDDVTSRYGFEDWQERPVDGYRVATRGFRPWAADLGGRELLRRKAATEVDDESWQRLVVGSPSEPVVIDCHEHADAEAARSHLLAMLDNNMLERLDPGPEGLGDAAFRHPEGAPAGLFLARGNLSLAITGAVTADQAVTELAGALDRRIVTREGLRRIAEGEVSEGESDLGPVLDAAAKATMLRLTDEGYLKFFARDGSITFVEGRPRLRPLGPAAQYEIFAAEPPEQRLPGRPAKP